MRIKSLMTPRVLRAVRRLLIHSNRSLTYSVYGTPSWASSLEVERIPAPGVECEVPGEKERKRTHRPKRGMVEEDSVHTWCPARFFLRALTRPRVLTLCAHDDSRHQHARPLQP